ncbi:MAG: hypothetical protein CVU11_13910 [Bacteroidetes bacterium HGW-Bacteroidetes-6]|jgi:WD40 repeat protein|nr:MAG: hypothetical protein CVU11_13910 [Bacteroidetes bacterium HGW-Bacteroidetes-6]
MKKHIVNVLVLMFVSTPLFSQNTYHFNTSPVKNYYNVETVFGLDWSSDGKVLYSCGGARQIVAFDSETFEVLRSSASLPFENYPKNISINSSNSVLAYYIFNGYEIDTIKLLNATTLKEIGSISEFETVSNIVFSPNGEVLYALGYSENMGSTLVSYNAENGSRIAVNVKEKGLWCFDISPDGKFLAAGVVNNSFAGIKIYDLQSGQAIKSISFKGDLNVLKFSPDGKYVAAGFYDNNVYLWDVATGAKIYTFSGLNGSVNTLDFSPDGKYIVIAGMDHKQTFKIFNTTTGAEVQSLDEACPDIECVRFSPDGNSLAVAYRTYGDYYKVATIRIFKLEK